MSRQMLNEKTWSHAAEKAPTQTQARTMTYGGVIVKSFVLVAFALVFAYVGWTYAQPVLDFWSRIWTSAVYVTLLFFLFMMGVMLLLTVLVWTKPLLALPVGLLFSALDGIWIGAISWAYNEQTNGIVGLALAATVTVFLVCLLLHGIGAFRLTERGAALLILTTISVGVLYLVSNLLLWLFGFQTILYRASAGGVAISVLILLLCAFYLLVDFAIIGAGVRQGVPKQFEWFAAMGLVSTLVWMYVEFLRLFAKIARRRAR